MALCICASLAFGLAHGPGSGPDHGKSAKVKLEVWHNILWSSYKAGVFSKMAELADELGIELSVVQGAETESDRVGLAQVDMSLHRYPMTLLFKGVYSAQPKWRVIWEHARRAATTHADFVILAGYHAPEYMVQALILWLRGKPRAVFCDSTAFDKPRVWWKGLLKRVVFWLCDYVFCYGVRAQQYVCSLGVPRDHTFWRCQAAGLPLGYSPEKIPAERAARALPGDAPLFLYVGRLSPEKRLEVLIRAFVVVLGDLPKARLRLVGSGPQGDELKALAAELGVAQAVEFTGGLSKDRLTANYLEATAMVLPSWSEPWGLVVNEALHYGCPVIVSDRCGCVPELVEDSDCGLVVACEDVGDLAAKMVRGVALWTDREAVARACLARIEPYSPENAARAILTGVNVVMARKGLGQN